MIYENPKKGIFLKRTSPFILEADTDEGIISVHINNLGDFSTMLKQGSEISYHKKETAGRKIQYELIAVKSDIAGWINLDSSAPNILVHTWLNENSYDKIKAEYKHENSKFDFYAEKNFDKYIIEVKGVYTYRDGGMVFPTGNSERTLRQLDDMITAAWQGYSCTIVFVLMSNEKILKIKMTAVPEFHKLLKEAEEAGIKFLKLSSIVDFNKIEKDRLENLSLY